MMGAIQEREGIIEGKFSPTVTKFTKARAWEQVVEILNRYVSIKY